MCNIKASSGNFKHVTNTYYSAAHLHCHSFAGESLSIKEGVKLPTQSKCERCSHVSSQAVCKACVLLEGLNKGKPRLGLGKSSKVDEHFAQQSGAPSDTTQTHTEQHSSHSSSPSHSAQGNVLRGLHNLDF